MLRNDPDEAVVRLAADVKAVQVGVDEDHHHVELGEHTVNPRDALCDGLQDCNHVISRSSCNTRKSSGI